MELPIGQRIRAWRTHLKKKQVACATAMGIRKAGLSRVENGWRDGDELKFQQVTTEQLEKLVEFLGLTMGEFYGDIPDTTSATPDPAPSTDTTDKIAAAS
jgi:transcriptional regulator with XRE-family HTH domain